MARTNFERLRVNDLGPSLNAYLKSIGTVRENKRFSTNP